MEKLAKYYKPLRGNIPHYVIYLVIFIVAVVIKYQLNKTIYSDYSSKAIGVLTKGMKDDDYYGIIDELSESGTVFEVSSIQGELDDKTTYREYDAYIILPNRLGRNNKIGQKQIQIITFGNELLYHELRIRLHNYFTDVEIVQESQNSKTEKKSNQKDSIKPKTQDIIKGYEVIDVDNEGILRKTVWDAFLIGGYIAFTMSFITVIGVMYEYSNVNIRNRIFLSPMGEKRLYQHLMNTNLIFVALLFTVLFIVYILIFGRLIHSRIYTLAFLNILMFVLTGLSFGCVCSIILSKLNKIILYYVLPLLCAIGSIFIPNIIRNEAILNLLKYLPFYWFINNQNIIRSYSMDYMMSEYWIGIIILLLFTCLSFLTFQILLKERKYNYPVEK